MADKNYIILECGMKVPVSDEIFKYYDRANEREKKRGQRRLPRETSLENMCELGNELLVAKLQKSIEDIVLDNLMREKLQEALLTLSKDEQILLNEIYYNRRTEREIAIKLNKSKTAIHSKKEYAMKKLFNYLKNF